MDNEFKEIYAVQNLLVNGLEGFFKNSNFKNILKELAEARNIKYEETEKVALALTGMSIKYIETFKQNSYYKTLKLLEKVSKLFKLAYNTYGNKSIENIISMNNLKDLIKFEELMLSKIYYTDKKDITIDNEMNMYINKEYKSSIEIILMSIYYSMNNLNYTELQIKERMRKSRINGNNLITGQMLQGDLKLFHDAVALNLKLNKLIYFKFNPDYFMKLGLMVIPDSSSEYITIHYCLDDNILPLKLLYSEYKIMLKNKKFERIEIRENSLAII